MKRTKSGKILLHADTPLEKEVAEEINEAIGKIGPIQMAGIGLAKQMERTADALKEGMEKIEQADQEFKEMVPDDVLEAAETTDPILEAELERLRRENAELKNKLNGKN